MKSLRFVLVSILIGASPFPALAAGKSRYPLVFQSVADLKAVGIALEQRREENPSVHFTTRCYYYGDGGSDVSLSDAFLAFLKSKGFSRRSACLALISGIRFSPETGKRLATFILVDPAWSGKRSDVGSGTMSDELPIALPPCFSQGLPYSDCAWNYDPVTGKKLSRRRSDKTKALGARITAFLDQAKSKGDCPASEEVHSTDPNEALIQGMLTGTGEFINDDEPSADEKEATAIAASSNATIYDCSTEFPRGYGYALYASGEADQVASDAVIAAATAGRKAHPQIDADKVTEIWEGGR